MRIEERDLILPALYIIDREGSATMTELIRELTSLFNPDGEDAVILQGRGDTKFSQKVRNLRSHRASNGMEEWTAIAPGGRYTITPAGRAYLSENREQVGYLFSNRFGYGDVASVLAAIHAVRGKKTEVVVYNEEDRVSEGKAAGREEKGRVRSRKLREAASEHYRDPDGKLPCVVCGFCFEDRYGERGKGFVEIHHERPLYQYSDAGVESYLCEAVKRVKPVCANCHRMIHRDAKRPMSVAELKNALRPHRGPVPARGGSATGSNS